MRCTDMITCPVVRVVKNFFPSYKRGGEGGDTIVHEWKVLRGVDLQYDRENRENREHLKYLRSVTCVMTNHNNIRTRELASKPHTNERSCLQFSFLMHNWLFSCKTIT